MNLPTTADLRHAIGEGTITESNWIAVDRYLNHRYMHLDGQGYDAWIKLPRVEMTEGGKALTDGLLQYRTWINKWFSVGEQEAMLASIALDEAESQAVKHVVPLGLQSLWVERAANREGVSVDAFVLDRLSRVANGERAAARREMCSS